MKLCEKSVAFNKLLRKMYWGWSSRQPLPAIHGTSNHLPEGPLTSTKHAAHAGKTKLDLVNLPR
jgi:hypothetical protein